MKKTLLLSLLFALCATMHAQTTPAQAVVGQYTGELYVSLMEENYTETTLMTFRDSITDEDVPVPYTVNIAVEESGTIVFSLNDFSFSGALLGDIRLPGIAVSDKGARYTFSENDPVRFNFLEGTEAEIVADASLDNTRSYVEGDSLVAYIPVVWVTDFMGDVPIYVLFKGVRPTTEGVSVVKVAQNAVATYDLAGRRQPNVASRAKGLYIVNGKKQIVK